MSVLSYPSGDPIQAGDRVLYDGEQGYVDFVVTARTGDDDLDWYLDEFPGGGVMIVAEGFGRVFLDVEALGDLLLTFVTRMG
ncbi:MAG: hypothetical protein ABW221_21900 [Vicinamibacteria bacterium]